MVDHLCICLLPMYIFFPIKGLFSSCSFFFCIGLFVTDFKKVVLYILYILVTLQFSSSVVSDTLQTQGLQQARLPYPSATPGACSNSCPLSRWCHPTISSSVIPFSSCPHSFWASGSFQWVSSSHQVAKVLELQLQHQPFQWIFRTYLL